jgi:hypothetical protein
VINDRGLVMIMRDNEERKGGRKKNAFLIEV